MTSVRHGDVAISHHLETNIEIAAGAERVWTILTDFEAYPEWNPFIKSVRGILEKGSRLEVRIQPPEGKGMTFRPTVLVAESGRELIWLGRLLLPGVFDGEHRFLIRPQSDDTVLFEQSEWFRGLLVPLFKTSLDRGTKKGFEEMNLALKARAEAA